MRTRARFLAHFVPVAVVGFGSACATHAPPAAPSAPPPSAPRGLPPIAAVTGPLRIDVVAPGEGEELPSRDSTFVYGSVGTGRATLTIDGAPVRVEPNGAFLAWLPVPATGVYRVIASGDGQNVTLDRRVRLPAPVPALPPERARIVEGTASPAGAWVVQPGERIDVSVRGSPGARAWLVLPDGSRVPLVESAAVEEAVQGTAEFGTAATGAARALPGVSRYSGFFLARPLVAPEAQAPRLAALPVVTGVIDSTEIRRAEAERERARATAKARAPAGKAKTRKRTAAAAEPVRPAGPTRYLNGTTNARVAGAAMLELVGANGDTARAPLPLTLAVLERPRVGVAYQPVPPDQTHRAEVVARAATSGPYNWFWPNGTRLALTGERGGMLRVALADNRSAWVSASEVRLLPEGTPPPYSRVGTVRMTPQPGWIDVRFALSQPLPFQVEEGLSSITVTLYGGQSDTNYMQYGGADPLIRYAEWRQVTDSIYTLTVNLTQSVWGYQAFFAGDGDLVLRIRRPPMLDAGHPLRGLKIAVDPGHPPGGATGPTRLAERDANLAIALKLQPLLQAAGATVFMTRTTDAAVPLNARPELAVQANADILLSIHNNGLPSGVNPFGNTGTSDYYFHPQSAELAQALDREIVHELGTQDLGPGRADLALVRTTWMPAVLTETMYLMVPLQEAALRNPDVQERIAQAHLRGLLDFLRARAREQR